MENKEENNFDIPQDSSSNSPVSHGHKEKDCWCKQNANNPLCIPKETPSGTHWIRRHMDMSEIADILGL